jgi:hypothetical protein
VYCIYAGRPRGALQLTSALCSNGFQTSLLVHRFFRASSTQPVLPVLLPICVLKMRFSTLISAAAFFELSIAGYVMEDDYMTDFYSNWNFFTGPDPTEGRIIPISGRD